MFYKHSLFFSSFGSLPVSFNGVLRYIFRRIYRVFFGPVPVPVNFVAFPASLAVVSYISTAYSLCRSSECVSSGVTACRSDLFIKKLCHPLALVSCVTHPVYGHYDMHLVLIDNNGDWSDFYYLVRTGFPALQFVEDGCCHDIGSWFAGYQGLFFSEGLLVIGKLWFDCHPFIIVPFVLHLLSTRSRIYLSLQYVYPPLQ